MKIYLLKSFQYGIKSIGDKPQQNLRLEPLLKIYITRKYWV